MFLKRKTTSETILFRPKYKDHLYDITSLVELYIENYNYKNGVVNIHIKSCTSAILINENGDSNFKKDLILLLSNIIQLGNTNNHNLNSDASIKSALIGPSKCIPFAGKKLSLSANQRIFFCEFDTPDIDREIIITPIRNF